MSVPEWNEDNATILAQRVYDGMDINDVEDFVMFHLMRTYWDQEDPHVSEISFVEDWKLYFGD